MKNLFKFLILVLLAAGADQLHAQTNYAYGNPIVVTSRTNDTATIYLRTPTKNINGIAWNAGNGKLEYRLPHDTLIISNDSIYFQNISGHKYFVGMLAAGGTGNTNSNVGTGFRIAIPGTNNLKTIRLVGTGSLDSSTSNVITINIPSNISSFTNDAHFSDSTKRSHDSVYRRVNGQWWFQYKDSVGGSGSLSELGVQDSAYWVNDTTLGVHPTTIKNIGSGYRLAVPGTDNIKTHVPGLGLIDDSTSNANAITTKLDTAYTNLLYSSSTTDGAINDFTVINVLNTPPGSPATGDQYRINTAPTGAWVGHANAIATWNGTSWDFTAPGANDYVYQTADKKTYQFKSSDNLWHASGGVAIVNNLQNISGGMKIGLSNNKDFSISTNNITRFALNNSGNPFFYSIQNGTPGTDSFYVKHLGEVRAIAANNYKQSNDSANSITGYTTLYENSLNVKLIFDSTFTANGSALSYSFPKSAITSPVLFNPQADLDSAYYDGSNLVYRFVIAPSGSIRLRAYASSGNAIVNSESITAPTTLTYASTTNLDFSSDKVQILTLAGNVTFTTSNLAAGREKLLEIIGDGSTRTFTFPSWLWIGASAPINIAAGKTAILSLYSFGTSNTTVIASYSVQP